MFRSLLCLLAPLACFGASNLAPEADQRLAHDIYKEMIEIKSGFTTGATTPVAEAVARRLRAAGFADSAIFLGGAIPKKSNIVVRYRGTGRMKPILLLAHEDVVEAKREDWSFDPFVFTEKDGYFYGRGTADDKAQAALWVANLIRMKREGYKPDRDIIVALETDEEILDQDALGIQWLLKNHRDLIDAEFALNEGGGVGMVNGKAFRNSVQTSEKVSVFFQLEVKNSGGHSSV
ncbi:MAG TPA: M20/M25/M40 family metallo-hydrolase, partial [Bryobacteraceae bacterium]|nr:M20/M25/M40 family metallo-hydrolase [Bryobacteraceae bacterium]